MKNILLRIDQIKSDPELERQKKAKLQESGGYTAIKESIRNIGLKEPLVVYKDNDIYFLCDGYNRLTAINELRDANQLPSNLDMDNIQCILIPKEIKNIIRYMTDIRQDLEPSLKAKCIRQLSDREVTRKDIAKMCGYSVNTIRNWLLVSRLIKPLQDMMDTGKLPVDTAVPISPLTEDGQYHLFNKIKDWKVIRRDEIRGIVAGFPSRYYKLSKEERVELGNKLKTSSIKEKQSISERKTLSKTLHKLSIEHDYIEEELRLLRTKVRKLVAWIEKIFRTEAIKNYIMSNHQDVFSDLRDIAEVELGRK